MKKKRITHEELVIFSKQIAQARKEVAISLALNYVGRADTPIKNIKRACEQIEKYEQKYGNK